VKSRFQEPVPGTAVFGSGSGRFQNRNRGTVKIWNRFGTGTAEPSKSGTASEPEPRNRLIPGTARNRFHLTSEPEPEPRFQTVPKYKLKINYWHCVFSVFFAPRDRHGTGPRTGFYGIPSRNPGFFAENGITGIYGINPVGSRPGRIFKPQSRSGIPGIFFKFTGFIITPVNCLRR